VHKFLVSIIPVNRLFCVVAANHRRIHRAKLTTAGVRRYQVFTPIPRQDLGQEGAVNDNVILTEDHHGPPAF